MQHANKGNREEGVYGNSVMLNFSVYLKLL